MTALVAAPPASSSVYRPTWTQFQFLESRAEFPGFFGGYGSGKTYAGAQKALRLALTNKGLPGIIVSPTWRMLKRTTLPTFKSICPEGLIADEKIQDGYIRLSNGSLVYCGSADHAGSLEGINLGWAWVDEARLVSREAFDVIVGRVRDRRATLLQTCVTTTPAMGWLSEFFDGRAGRDSFHGSTRENAHNLAPGFIDRLLATYSKRKAEALVEGRFTVLTGAVYEDLDESRHRVEWRWTPKHRTAIFMDFGVAAPAVIFAQVLTRQDWDANGRELPAGAIVVFGEMTPDQTPTVRLMPQVKAFLAGRDVHALYCDPAGNAREQSTGIPQVETVREHLPGVDVRWSTDHASRWIPNGVALVQGALSPGDGSLPRLYIDGPLWTAPGRRGLVKSMRGYSYPERADGSQASDMPIKDGVYDHINDALRYGVTGVLRDAQAGERPRVIRSVSGGH